MIDSPEFTPRDRSARALNTLWALGLLMDGIAIFFAYRYPLMGHSNGLTDIGKLAHYKGLEFAEYVGGMLGIAVIVLLALRQARRLPASTAAAPIFTCGAVAVLFFGFMYPVNAIDIFIYASRSRLWSEYGDNPIAVKPNVHDLDAWRRFASEWGNSVSPYGPLWNWIAWPITKISGAGIGQALAGFKLLAGASILAGAALIYTIANRLRPGAGAAAALFYLWNPLLLWEGSGNGHNDVVMLVPVLLAALMLVQRRYPFVVPLLVTAALIKYVALLLVPLAAAAIWRLDPAWRARARNVLLSALGSAAATVFALAPFFDVKAIRASINEQGNIVLTSPASLSVGLLKDRYLNQTIVHWDHVVGISLFAIGYVILLAVVIWRPERVVRAFFEVLFLYVMTASWTVRPWYAIWLVGLAALLPLGWPSARAFIFSLTGLASYGLWIWGWYWWKVDYFLIQNVAVVMMFAPPLFVGLMELIAVTWRRVRRQPAPIDALASVEV